MLLPIVVAFATIQEASGQPPNPGSGGGGSSPGAVGCEKFPNDTDKRINWWPCCRASEINLVDVKPLGPSGAYQYPINFASPFYIQATMTPMFGMPAMVYDPLRIDIRVWSYSTCNWQEMSANSVLLWNQDACGAFVNCPITANTQQDLLFKTDFTALPISTWGSDELFLIQYRLSERFGVNEICFMVEARAFTH